MKRFDLPEDPSPPGIYFQRPSYAVCTRDDDRHLYSTFSEDESLRRFMEGFDGELVGVRVNDRSEDMEKALNSYFDESAAVLDRFGDPHTRIYGDEVEPLAFPEEELEIYELFEDDDQNRVQEVV